MAAQRTLTVKIIGDSASLQRSFQRSSKAAAGFNRDIGKATRGALAGSGAFRSLGRSFAFASGTFLGVAGVSTFLRTSIDAAKEAAVTQKQLGAQFKASGLNLKAYQGAIDKTANRLSLLAGFENDEVKAGFTTIFRASGNVSKSLRDVALAADIARAKHIDLSKASTLVAKVEAGNTGILRRQGVALAKNATVEQALTIARLKFLGQAKAGTTEQERFGAVLHNTEEIIGTGILPTLNKYLASTSVWLTKMNESGRLQKDVNHIMGDAKEVLHDAGVAAKFVRDGFGDLSKVAGSTENAIKLLIGLRVAWKLSGWASGFTALGAAAGEAGAAGKVALLTSRLAVLRATGPIIIPVGIAYFVKKFGAKNVIESLNPFGDQTLGPRIAAFPKGESSASNTAFSKAAERLWQREHPTIANTNRAAGFGGLGGNERGTGARALGLAGQFNLADLKLQQAFLTKTTADDRVRLVIEAAITRQQLAQTKTLKDRTAKTQQLVGILSQIQGIDQANAEAAKAAAQVAKQRAAAALAIRQAFTVPLSLQVAQARAGALGLDSVGKSILEKIKTTATRALKSGRLGLQGQLDAWQTIAGVNDQLKNAVGPQTKTKLADLSKLTAGLGLDNAARKALEQRFAGATVSPRGQISVRDRTAPIVVHTHTYVDGREIAPTVTRHQQKAAKRNPSQRRGPNAGV